MDLSPLSTSPRTEVVVPPPPRFKPVDGVPSQVQFWTPGVFQDANSTAAQSSGIRYEQKVHQFLGSVLPGYRPSQGFRFYDRSGVRFCVPDGVILNPARTIIFEFKFQHMPEAWWQLRQLYEPVLRSFVPGAEIHLVEVCRSYDPAVPFPERVKLIDSIEEYVKDPFPEFGVFRWKR